EDAQGLGVALEAADVRRRERERPLTVVPEGRVAEVVREARGVDDVGVAAERLAELAAHLGDLEGVRQAGAHEVVGRRSQDLGLVGEAAQGRGVYDARTVALERGAGA